MHIALRLWLVIQTVKSELHHSVTFSFKSRRYNGNINILGNNIAIMASRVTFNKPPVLNLKLYNDTVCLFTFN